MPRVLILMFLLLLSIGDLRSQARSSKNQPNIFGLGLVAGVNNSQLDGDYFTGFNKAGFYGGLRGMAILAPRIMLNVELLYSVKGSKIEHSGVVNEFAPRDRLIDLSYAEVPILFNYELTTEVHGPFIEVGVSFARLLKTKIEENERSQVRGTFYGDIKNQFNSNDISALFGIGYEVGNNLELALRYSFGISRIYTNQVFVIPNALSPTTKEVEFLRNYHLSLLLSYRIL